MNVYLFADSPTSKQRQEEEEEGGGDLDTSSEWNVGWSYRFFKFLLKRADAIEII